MDDHLKMASENAERLKMLEDENVKLWGELKNIKHLLTKHANEKDNSEVSSKLQADSKSESHKHVILSGIPFRVGRSYHDVFISFIENSLKTEIDPNMVMDVQILGWSVDEKDVQIVAKVHSDLKDALSKVNLETKDKEMVQGHLYFIDDKRHDILIRAKDTCEFQNNTDSYEKGNPISFKTNDGQEKLETTMDIIERNPVLIKDQCSSSQQCKETSVETGHTCAEDYNHPHTEPKRTESHTKSRGSIKSGKRKGYGSFVAAGLLVHTMINLGKYGPKKSNSTPQFRH